MQVKRANINKNHTRNLREEEQKVGSSIQELKKVVLKESEYEWDGLYLYSSKKNQR